MRHFYQKEEQERKYLPAYEGFDSKQLAKMTHVEFFEYPVWEKESLWNLLWNKNVELIKGRKNKS